MSFFSSQLRRTSSGQKNKQEVHQQSSNYLPTSSPQRKKQQYYPDGSSTNISSTIFMTSNNETKQNINDNAMLMMEESRNRNFAGGNGEESKGQAMKPLLIEEEDGSNSKLNESHDDSVNGNHGHKNFSDSSSSSKTIVGTTYFDYLFIRYCPGNPDFFKQGCKLLFAFFGLQASYLTWGYMQELIMTTKFNPTPHAPDGKFPSAAFCVFSNRFLALIIALIAVKYKHGSFFSNGTAPLSSFTPCALSNTISSWSQYASLKYVNFLLQTVFKSSKIIPVMMMGKVLKGTQYPWNQYLEALLITIGVAIFSVLSKSDKGNVTTELKGLLLLLTYVVSDSFTSQWQDKVYQQYGRSNVDQYQMMLGVNVSAICITTAGLIISNDIPKVYEFLLANPEVFYYNVITAITSATGQLSIFYTIREFGPVVFTVIMTVRQMLSMCISAIVFGHEIKPGALLGSALVFGVIFYQIYNKYKSKSNK